MRKVLFTMLAMMLSLVTFAQISTPAASPSAEVKQDVGLTDITINYSRPAMKGRTIFAADGLVPFGKTWRTGANAATKITFGDKVRIAGVELEAGSYAVLTVPTATDWTFSLYPYEGRSWGSYVEKDVSVSTSAPVKAIGMDVESFTIMVSNVVGGDATIDFMWENTLVSLPVSVDFHEAVMANIKEVMAGPSANDYHQAAGYLLSSGGDLETALEYIQLANADEENQRFWMVRREALILAELDRKQEAIVAAKRSIELAEENGNEDYVRMNQKSIKEWMN